LGDAAIRSPADDERDRADGLVGGCRTLVGVNEGQADGQFVPLLLY